MCIFFLCIGMDTTAHTLAFTVYALAKYPEIQQKAQELADLLGEGDGGSNRQAELPKYLEALLKESMRKYPTAATGSFRLVTAAEGYTLTPDIFLPKGWWVVVNIFCLQNSRSIWGADADEFLPERWLASGSGSVDAGVSATPGGPDVDPLDSAIDPLDHGATSGACGSTASPFASPAAYGGTGPSPAELSFCPFSFGSRNCLGMNLALMELRMALCMLLSKYHFELCGEDQLDEANVLETSFTMRPRDGMPVRITKRVK